MTQNSTRNPDFLEKIQIFSNAQLKYIAFLSMLIDHVNKALIYPNLKGSGGLQILSDLSIYWGGSHSRYLSLCWSKDILRQEAE